MSNVSDFKLSAAILREACRLSKRPFVDMPVSFSGQLGEIKGGQLCLGQTDSIGQTLFRVVQAYLQNSESIVGQQLNADHSLSITTATVLRKAVIGSQNQTFPDGKPDEFFMQRLYQRPFVWAAMKNLICPIYGKPTKNVLLACGTSPYMDVSRYFRDGEIKASNAPKEELIFVNDDVDNDVTKNAALLVEAIRAHDLSPTQVVAELFESTMYEKLLGIAKLAFVSDEQVEDFTQLLFALSGLTLEQYPHLKQENGRIVVAQGANIPMTAPANWWYLGLIEKMLSPARGPDWSTHQSLEKYVKEFWEQVEIIKSRKAQGDGVPFNDLLRLKQLQSTEPSSIDQTIQGLLSSHRIW